MTNEELAVRVQNGESEFIPQLWEQVVKFVTMKARRYAKGRELNGFDTGGCELEDLVQEAFFAMMAAVGYYKPDEGFVFLTYLDNTLKTAFAEATGTRTKRKALDGIHRAVSLDAPIGEDGDATMLDFTRDDATTGDQSVEEQATRTLYLSELQEVLERGIALLPERYQRLIRLLYYERKSWQEIASELNVTCSRAQQMNLQSLRNLRETSEETGLSKFVEERTNYYLHVGKQRFGNTRISSVEEIVLLQERLTQEWLFGDIYNS